jgi:hypothetical protein
VPLAAKPRGLPRLPNGYIDQPTHTILVTVVMLNAVVPTLIATTFFEPQPAGDETFEDGTTFVTIRESGFASKGNALIKEVADSTQGFTIVLAGAKALLEHGIRLNLVADRYAEGRPGASGATE